MILRVCLLAISMALVSPAAPDVAAVVRALEQRYNRAATLRAAFEQRHLVAGRPRRIESGILVMRKPGRMRWEYERPAGKLFVCDGKWVWLWSPEAQQVERARLKEAEDFRAPLAFLLGRLDLRRTFSTFEAQQEGEEIRLSAWPRNDRLPFTRVDFWLGDGFEIRRLVIHQIDATAMEFRFDGEQLNLAIPESLFRFQPPPGVPVVEAGR
jgi:outer membrane lipoprotein carrier protein